MKHLKFYKESNTPIDPDYEYIEDCVSSLYDYSYVKGVEIIRCWYPHKILQNKFWSIWPGNLEKRNYPSISRPLIGDYIDHFGDDTTRPFPGYCIDVNEINFVRGEFCIDKVQNNSFHHDVHLNSFKELSDEYKNRSEFSAELSNLENRLKSRFPLVNPLLSRNMNCIRFYIVSDIDIK